MIPEELLINYTENPEYSFRKLLKEGSIAEHVHFQKVLTPERVKENLLGHCLRLWMRTVDFVNPFLISCRRDNCADLGAKHILLIEQTWPLANCDVEKTPQTFSVSFITSQARLKYLLQSAAFEKKRWAVSYTHLTLPTRGSKCRSRWSPYH